MDRVDFSEMPSHYIYPTTCDVLDGHEHIDCFTLDDELIIARNADERDKIHLCNEYAAFSEFFDFQNGALDPDDIAVSPSPAQSTNATPAFTPPSIGARGDLPHTNDTIIDISQNAVLNAYNVNMYPESAQPGNAMRDPLRHWPIEHIAIHILPPVSTVTPTDGLNECSAGARKRSLEEHTSGQSCFDSCNKRSVKRKIFSDEERENARRVRAQGACLRCYVQKLKCSEGRPCEGCQAIFNRAHGSKMLQWTACISSKLQDINIFTLGVSLSTEQAHSHNTSWWNGSQEIDASLAVPIYRHGVQLASRSGLLADFDHLYFEVLQHMYGDRAPEVHPFILQETNPLYMLIRLNVILLGSPVIGPKIVGYIRFLQTLRAACAVVAFECFEKAFERNMLAASSPIRQVALIVQAALLLDQVVEMNADASGFALCFAHGKNYRNMHQHLIQYISHYLRTLISRVFGKTCYLSKYLSKSKSNSGELLGEAFWDNLAGAIPIMPLGKPPRVRSYADLSFKSFSSEVNLEGLYRAKYT